MTEIAIREDRTAELAVTQRGDAAIARLASWAQSATAAHEVATSLVQTSFVPAAFRNKPYEATAAILAGAEVGLNPMASLRSFDVIQGTAAPRANTLRAIVQSMGHEIRLTESTETRAIVEGRRRGESTWQKSTWTIQRAQKLGLTGKDNWKNQPQAMLVARATAECCRLIASDAILGIGYAVEEISDESAVDEVAEVRPAKRTARRAPVERAAAPEPELDEPVVATVVEEQGEESITPDQLKKLHTVMGREGYGDRDAGLAYLSERVGRDITSSKELTKREAMRVIDGLEFPDEPPFDEASEPPVGGAA